MTLPELSRRRMTKKSWSMATNLPNLAGIGGVVVVEMFSGERLVGLEGVKLA